MANYKNKNKNELIAEIERLEKLNTSLKVKNDTGLLEKIAENYPNSCVYIIEKDLTIGFASGQEFKKQGLDPNALIGLSLERIFNKYAPIIKKHYLKTFQGEELSFELSINEQYQLHKTVPLFNESGKADRILATVENITARKLSEQKILQSESRLSTLLSNLPGMAYSCLPDDNWTMLFVNDACEQLTGYKAAQFIDNAEIPYNKLIHSDDQLMVNQEVAKALKTGKHFEFEYRITTKEGKEKWMWERGKKSVAPDNNTILLEGVIHDISERKKAEIKLKKLLDGQKILLKNDPSLIIYKDTKNNIIKVNDTVAKITNLPKEEIEGKATSEIYPSMADQYYEDDKIVMQSGEPQMGIIESLPTSDGSIKWLLTNKIPIKNEANEVVGITLFSSDITDLKITQDILAESKERFELAMAATKDGLYDWNLETNQIYYSPGWKHMLGYTDEELANDFTVWENLINKEDAERSWKMQQELINKQRDNFELEFKMKHKDGHWVDILSRAEAVFNKSGKAIRIVGTHIDISERKNHEIQLSESEKKYRDLIHMAQEGIWVIDKNNITSFANPSMAKMLQYSPKEMIGKSLFDYMDEAGVAIANENLERRKSGQKEQHDFEFICKNGDRIFCALATAPIIDAIGDYQGAIAGIIDITERKLSEEYIKKNQSLLQQAEEISNQGAWEWDIGKDEWTFSENWLRIHGCQLSGIKREELMTIVYPEDAPKVEKSFQGALQGRTPYHLEYRIVRENDGKVRYVRASGNFIYNNSEQAVKMYGVTRDISDSKKAEESHHLHSEMLANIADGVYLVKLDDGTIVYSNPRFEEMFGYEKDELIGKHVSILNAPTDKNPQETAKEIIDIIKDAGNWQGEIKNIKKDKTLFWSSANVSIFDHSEYGKVLVTVHSDITSQKLAEERIKDSEEKYKALYENAPLAYQSLNEDGTFKDINPRWLKTLGYERQEVIGEKYSDFLHPDWNAHFQKNFPAFKKRGYVSDVHYKIRHKKGHYIDISFEGCVGYNPDGSFRQTYCVFQDITARKQAEDQLKTSEERLKTILDSSPFPIAVVDTNDNNIKYWSFSAKQLFGHAPKTSLEWYELAYPDLNYRNDVIERWKPFLKIAHESSKAVNTGEYNIVCKNGSTKICEIYAQFIPENLIVTLNDITDRKLTDEKLKQSEKQFRFLAENSQDMICRISFPSGVYEYVSPASNQIFGYSPDAFIDTPLLIKKAIHPDWILYVEKQWDLIFSGEMSASYEYQIIHGKSKEVRWLHQRNSLNKNQKGELIAIEGIITDITDQKKAQEALLKNERRLKNMFASMSEGFSIQDVICDDEGNPIDLRFVDANPAFEIQTGLKNSETLGHTLLELFPPSEKLLIEKYGNVGITGEPISFEAKFGPLNIYYNVNAFQTAPNQFGVLFTDINERKLHEIELTNAKEKVEESETHLKYSQKLAKLGHWKLNPETLEVEGSDELLNIFDIELGSLTLESFMSVVHPEDTALNKATIEQGIREGTAWDIEHRLLFNNGETKWIRAIGKPQLDADNKVKQIDGIVQDITEQKKAELALIESEEKFMSIYEQSPIAIQIYNMEGKLLRVNKKTLDLFGLDDEKHIQTFNLWEDPNLTPEKSEALKKGESIYISSSFDFEFITGVISFPTNRKGIIHLDMYVVPLKKENKITGYLVQIVEITERKLAEDKLKKHQENLEELVKERTIDLEDKNKELERFNNLFVDREIRIKELKNEITIIKNNAKT